MDTIERIIDREFLETERRLHETDQARHDLMIGAALSGNECFIYGRRVRLSVEWLEEPPFGEDLLHSIGQGTWEKATARLRGE